MNRLLLLINLINVLLISSTLADKIPSVPHFNSYLSNPVDSIFYFHTVTKENINKLKNKVRYGHDSIFNIMIKSAHEPLIKPLTLLINQTISKGILPNYYFFFRIRPLFKQGSSSLFSNYRPLPLLSSLSKI